MKEILLTEALLKLWAIATHPKLKQRLTESDLKFLGKFSITEDNKFEHTRLLFKRCSGENCTKVNCNGVHMIPLHEPIAALDQKTQNKLFTLSYRF